MRTLAIARVERPELMLAHLVYFDGEVRVRIEPQRESVELRRFLEVAAHARPRLLLREPARGGRVVIMERIVSPGEPSWPRAWADAVTYAPGANGFVALPAESNVDVAAYSPLPRATAAFPSDARPSFVRVNCPCGATYRFRALTCPACGGTDPLGYLVERAPESLERWLGKMAGRLREVRAPHHETLSRSLAEHTARLDQPPPDVTSADQKTAAKRLLADFAERVSIGGLTSGTVEAVRASIAAQAAAFAETSARIIDDTRSAWTPDPIEPWQPNRASVTLLAQRTTSDWSASLSAIRRVVDAQAAAIARFAPVHRTLRKAADATLLGAVVRWGLTVLSAVKTGGLSLVFKAGLWAFKSSKEQKTLERFDEALGRLHASLSEAVCTIEACATASASQMRTLEGELTRFLLVQLSYDYAAAPPSRQRAIAVALSRHIEGSAPRFETRGPPSASRTLARSVSKPAVVLVAVLIFGLLVWGLALLLRRGG